MNQVPVIQDMLLSQDSGLDENNYLQAGVELGLTQAETVSLELGLIKRLD